MMDSSSSVSHCCLVLKPYTQITRHLHSRLHATLNQPYGFISMLLTQHNMASQVVASENLKVLHISSYVRGYHA